jgi:hypothetical protein
VFTHSFVSTAAAIFDDWKIGFVAMLLTNESWWDGRAFQNVDELIFLFRTTGFASLLVATLVARARQTFARRDSEKQMRQLLASLEL